MKIFERKYKTKIKTKDTIRWRQTLIKKYQELKKKPDRYQNNVKKSIILKCANGIGIVK